jgi:homoserine trans-succinylase
MPCQSYDTAWAANSNDYEIRKLKTEADKLARIACRALDALTEAGQADFLLLKDDETREWWVAHQEADRKAREKEEARIRREELKAAALSKLTQEEREALGIKPRATFKAESNFRKRTA